MLEILKANALFYISKGIGYIRNDKSTFEHKWNSVYQNDMIKLAQAHAIYLVCLNFTNGLAESSISSGLKVHLERLRNIHLASMIVKYADGAILSKFAKGKHLAATEQFMYEQIELVRPQLLNLLESCSIPEMSLNSVIGARDGNIYENLYKAAAFSRLNNKTSLDSTLDYLKPLSRVLMAKM